MLERSLVVDDDPLPEDSGFSRARGVLERLYREQRFRLQRLLARQMPDDLAQDLVQQAFVRLASLGETRLDELERPEIYLRTIATNLARDDLRGAQRQSRGQHSSDTLASLEGTDQIANLEARDMLGRMENAMLGLKPRTRAIFMAHRIDGLSYAEIAARTGLSIKGVEKQMSKAIAHLDRFLSRVR
jgi:RNA polymerase sigma-70 factor (ECF subfamily)